MRGKDENSLTKELNHETELEIQSIAPKKMEAGAAAELGQARKPPPVTRSPAWKQHYGSKQHFLV